MKLQMKDFDSVRNETIAFDENENQKIVATYSVKDGNMWFAYFSPKTIKGNDSNIGISVETLERGGFV